MGDSDDHVAAAVEGGDVDAVGKIENVGDGTPSSMESTPEPDQDGAAEATAEPAQPQKRKGGRKPIYATSEERKQRNRQAQAAFRERRTEYIKQLEATIKQNEDSLATLQQSHRSAADECLMLRYKNSLLERILLEKGMSLPSISNLASLTYCPGIDVQSELQMKTGSPTFPPGFMQQVTGVSQMQSTQPPLQRAAIQRQHARRSGQALTPKLQPGQASSDMSFPNTSPQAVPTPSSHVSSPSTLSTRSPIAITGGMTPPTSGVHAQSHGQQYHQFARSQQPPLNHAFYPPHQQPQRQAPRPAPPSNYQSSTSISSRSPASQSAMQQAGPPGSAGSGGGSGNASAVPSASAYYPSPFQKHIDQLEQEYDTQDASHSMLDQPDPDHDHPSDPDTYEQHGLQGTYPPQQQYEHPTRGQVHGFGFQHHGQPPGMPPPGQQQTTPQSQYEQQQMQPAPQTMRNSGDFETIPHMIDPNDPMLDADPFGLSASMHYPTAYSFDQGR